MKALKNFVKYLARSRSFRFLADHDAAYLPGVFHRYRWQDIDITYRPGSSDTHLIYNILLKSGRKGEYAAPREWKRDPAEVEVVLDIGANIGISSLYFSSVYPNARIYAFEPVPENFALLQENTRAVGRITAINAALGREAGELRIFASDLNTNFGGFSLHETGTDRGSYQTVEVRNAQMEMERLGIKSADLIKIDTEGAEWDILTAFDPRFLAGTQLIMGELHGHKDFALLDRLAPDFDIGLRKGIRNRLFNFYALGRSPSPA